MENFKNSFYVKEVNLIKYLNNKWYVPGDERILLDTRWHSFEVTRIRVSRTSAVIANRIFSYDEKESVLVFALSSGTDIRPPCNWRSLIISAYWVAIKIVVRATTVRLRVTVDSISRTGKHVRGRNYRACLLSLAGDSQRDGNHQGERS